MTCQHRLAYARGHDPLWRLYCPECDTVLDKADSLNVVLALLRQAAGITKKDSA